MVRNVDRLDLQRSMRHLFFDTETHCFRPGLMAPPVVCLQYCRDDGDALIVHARAQRDLLIGLVRDSLLDPCVTLVGHNIAYDMVALAALDSSLLPAMFDAYAAGRVRDTQIRQQLADIARGRFRTRRYNLASCAEIAGMPEGYINKEDPWRTRYAELECVALSDWPAEAREYALRDALATRTVYQSQCARYSDILRDDAFQAYKFFCLRLMSNWGVRTDARGVESLRVGAEQELDEIRELLVTAGLVRTNGTRNVKATRARVIAAYAAQGKDYPRPRAKRGAAPSVNPATDADACANADDYILEEYANYSQMSKVLSSDVPMLAAGAEYPIHTHFDLVESGRTSSASPNIQNPRRLPGVRECFVPRPGNAFIEVDMSALELRTVAQVCRRMFGQSALAEVLNAGRDPHTALAAQMLGKSYEWTSENKDDPEVSNMRVAAKGMNFGFPGGLGAQSFPAYAWKAYKVRVAPEQVREWKAQWLEQFPEFRNYHELIGRTHEKVEHLFTRRLRGGCTFTAAANSYFQGLGADACGGALIAVTRACYADRRSPLFGCRPVNFMHDSVLTEVPIAHVHDALAEQERLMLEGSAPYLPDVPPRVDGKAMLRWSKDAMTVRVDGRVVPWSPLETGETLDAYARRTGHPTDALSKTFEVQRRAQEKAAERAAKKKAKRA